MSKQQEGFDDRREGRSGTPRQTNPDKQTDSDPKRTGQPFYENVFRKNSEQNDTENDRRDSRRPTGRRESPRSEDGDRPRRTTGSSGGNRFERNNERPSFGRSRSDEPQGRRSFGQRSDNDRFERRTGGAPDRDRRDDRRSDDRRDSRRPEGESSRDRFNERRFEERRGPSHGGPSHGDRRGGASEGFNRRDDQDRRSPQQDRFNRRSDEDRKSGDRRFGNSTDRRSTGSPDRDRRPPDRRSPERSFGDRRENRFGNERRRDDQDTGARNGGFNRSGDRRNSASSRNEESRYREPERKSFQWDDRPRRDERPDDRSNPASEDNRFNRRPDEDRKSGDRRFGNPTDRRAPGSPDRDHRSPDRRSPERPTDRKDRDEDFRRKVEDSQERRVGRPRAPEYDVDRMREQVQGTRKKGPRKDEKAHGASADTGLVRLNRYIANAGICSRRDADTLIANGDIKVNGNVVTEMGYKVKPGDVVKYGNKALNPEKMVYVLLNKPKDYITTTDDPDDRHTVMDLIAGATPYRIYPVGRLDRNTTGLLLLTNDGELAEKLTHPSNNIKKVYQVEIDKPITDEHFDLIMKGVELEDGFIKPDDLGIVTPDAQVVGVEIHSGRNRIVRRIFEKFGYEVTKLDRTVYAGLNKKDLPRGKWRYLDEKEVIRLKFLL